jgi:5-methylcytosine-specific restriction endonuclease McrA
MKLDIDFTNLENLVKNMGASTVDWVSNVTITHVETDWIIDLETKGIEVGLDDIEITASGLLKYRNEQILLYIKEINSYSYNGNYNLPKFHFYQCRTLNDMQSRGRFDRYVVTQRKTGYFLMDKKVSYDHYEKDVEEKLNVCKNCLNWYNKNYRKHYEVEAFDLIEFFEHFTKSPITRTPTYTDKNAPVSGYTADWNEVSKQRKEQCGYICQQCGVNLSNYKNLIHTHHANGVKSDNTSSNLKVLCIECHSEQPSHGHIKSNASHEILEVQRIKNA